VAGNDAGRVPEQCQQSEKGVDIEICCDALHLAAAKLMDRLLLLTNDSDFVPLRGILKQLGQTSA